MTNLILLIILVGCLGGMFFIISRKLPALKAIEVLEPKEFVERPLGQRIKDKFKESKFIKGFSTEKILKKICLRAKILFLKGERRMDQYLRKVSHSQKFEDDYWEGINKKKE